MKQLGLKVQVSSVSVGQTCHHIPELLDSLRFAGILDAQSGTFTIWCPISSELAGSWVQDNLDRMARSGWIAERVERKV